MGLSSSQARLLHLTGRMHQIEYKAQRLEAQKLQLANESNRVYEDYEAALDATKIQYDAINKDGSITYVDATLNALENGVVSDYDGETSNNTYLLYDGVNNVVKVTREFADAYGIQGNTAEDPGTLEEWLRKNHADDEEVMVDTTDYTNIKGAITPVKNVIKPGATTPAHTEYSVEGAFNPAVDTTQPGVAKWTVEKNNLSNVTENGYSAGALTKYTYTVSPSNSTGYKKIESQVFTFSQDELNSTLNDLGLRNGAYATFAEIKGIKSDKNGITMNRGTNYATDIKRIGGSTKLSDALQIIADNTTAEYDKENGTLTYNNNNSILLYDIDDYWTHDETGFYTLMYNHETVNGSNLTLNIDSKIVDWFYKTDSNRVSMPHNGCLNLIALADGLGYNGSKNLEDLTVREYFDYLKTNKPQDFDYTVNSDGSFSYSINSKSSTGNYWDALSAGTQGLPEAQKIKDIIYSKGDINAPSTTDIKEYFAYQMYNRNNSKTYDDYLSQINGYSYNDYQWVSLYKNKNDDVINALISNSASDINNYINTDYDTEHYNLNQSGADSFVVKYGISTQKTAESCTKNDVILALAKEMNTVDNSKNVKEYRDLISAKINALSDEDVASLSTHYNNSTEWSKIAQALINGSDITAYTTKFDNYDITMRTGDNLTIKETQIPEKHGLDTVELPNIKGITSNILAAFGKAGYGEIKEEEIEKFLTDNYGQDTTANNNVLANINKAVCDYIEGNGSIDAIYNHIYNNQSLNLTDSYPAAKYSFERKDLGKCNVTYGTKQTGTGERVLTKNIRYYDLVDKYNKLKSLSQYKFEIVEEPLCSNPDYISNWITQSGAHFLKFGGTDENGTLILTGTNVSVETSLREVSNEKNLKKAEAQYEADMKRIDQKDKKYDTDLAALETERNATKEEMETLKTVAKDNVDRTFKLFG